MGMKVDQCDQPLMLTSFAQTFATLSSICSARNESIVTYGCSGLHRVGDAGEGFDLARQARLR